MQSDSRALPTPRFTLTYYPHPSSVIVRRRVRLSIGIPQLQPHCQPGKPSALPSSSWRLVRELNHSLSLLDVRESHTSLDFLQRRVGAFRSCFFLVHPVPSSVRLPCLRRRPFRRKLGGCRRMPPSRSHARTRPLPAGLRSLFPRFASTATGSHLIRGPDFTWRPPPLRLGGLRFGGGYLATAKHSGSTRRQAPSFASGQTRHRKRRIND